MQVVFVCLRNFKYNLTDSDKASIYFYFQCMKKKCYKLKYVQCNI